MYAKRLDNLPPYLFARIDAIKAQKRAEGVGYIYTVRSGDNLDIIAKRNRTTVKDIMRWNRLKSTVIRPGQKLRIEKPKPRG